MRTIILAATVAMLAGTAPVNGAVLTMGSSYAETCYRSAESRIFRRASLDACDNALASEALMVEDRVGTLVNRGILQMLAGRLGSANRDFDEALALDPTEPEAWLNKGIARMNAGDSKSALPFLEKAIELQTAKPQIAYYARGLAHEDTGNLKAAYADLRRAQELAPRWREPGIELARYQVRTR